MLLAAPAGLCYNLGMELSLEASLTDPAVRGRHPALAAAVAVAVVVAAAAAAIVAAIAAPASPAAELVAELLPVAEPPPAAEPLAPATAARSVELGQVVVKSASGQHPN